MKLFKVTLCELEGCRADAGRESQFATFSALEPTTICDEFDAGHSNGASSRRLPRWENGFMPL
jgi:hypothetical protein